MRTFASTFAERGYTALEVDIGLPASKLPTSQDLLHYLEAELASQVRLAAIPFAPVLFARTGATLIAQTYISSNPASALVLISPPTSNSSQTAARLLPTPLGDFDYEPRFPLLIVDTLAGIKDQVAANRLVREQSVDTIGVSSLDGVETLTAIERWMDSVSM